MKLEMTPETAVLSVKFSVQPIVCWPPPLNASRKRLIFHDVSWCIAFFLIAHLIPTSILHSWKGTREAAALTKNFAECLAIFTTSMKMIIIKSQQSRMQIALTDMENFIKNADAREKECMANCMKRCGRFYLFVEITCFLTAGAFCCGPLILPQPLPGHSEYPFEWKDSPGLKAVLYFSHSWGAFQMAAAVIVDVQVALIMWIFGVRFELLAEDFKNACNSEEFGKCVQRHQQLIESLDEITITIRYIALDVVLNSGITNICAGYQFVSHQPFGVVAQFFLMFCVTCLELLMYAWPADNLMTLSEDISMAVYDRQWSGEPRKMTRGTQIIIARAQKPMVIEINGVLPTLNLDFYGKFLTTSFSYFTTLRALVG